MKGDDGFDNMELEDKDLDIRERMEKEGLDPFANYGPDDPQYKMLFGERRPPQEPFKHTFRARRHMGENLIVIAETYEGQREGFFLEEHAERLRAMGASPDADFSYAWTLPYTAGNWSKVMLFIRDTDSLLEPVRAMYGLCWHCGVIVKGTECPYCGKRVQAWYNTDLEVETGESGNAGVFRTTEK